MIKHKNLTFDLEGRNILFKTALRAFGIIKFHLLKTKRNLLYIRNQSVPRCKHFPPRLFKD